jgi:tRNA uridine 5-carbamoylmethylation protein Kti12
MFVGLPYSGKSYLAKSLGLYDGDYEVISSDKILLEWAVASETSYNLIFKDKVDEAQKEATKRLLNAFNNDSNVVIDQTNLTIASRRRKLSQCPKDYNKVCIVIPEVTREELEQRKSERSSHVIADSVIENMRNIYQPPSLDEGFDVIYYAGFDDIVITKDT